MSNLITVYCREEYGNSSLSDPRWVAIDLDQITALSFIGDLDNPDDIKLILGQYRVRIDYQYLRQCAAKIASSKGLGTYILQEKYHNLMDSIEEALRILKILTLEK